MKSDGTNCPDPGRAARGPLRDERGMLLVLVMIVLLITSTLAASSLINAFLERNIAKNQNYASIALQAAEAGLADGMVWLRANVSTVPNSNDADFYTNASKYDWTRTIGPVSFARDLNGDGDTGDPGESGGSYTVTLRFKREWRDLNGDGDCIDAGESCDVNGDGDCLDVDGAGPGDDGAYGEDRERQLLHADNDGQPGADCAWNGAASPRLLDIVLYNRGLAGDMQFNYPQSDFTGAAGDRGFPVVEIRSVGTFGAGSYREIVSEVARNKFNATVPGAFTSRGPVTVSGSARVDGRGYAMDGVTLDTDCGALPGVLVDASQTAPDCTTRVFGTPCAAAATGPLPSTAWGFLGLSSETEMNDMLTDVGAANLDAVPCQGPNDPPVLLRSSVASLRFNNSAPCTNYRGIIVIHNPNYVPATWASSCPGGVTGSGYCTAANAPAEFFMNGNVQWTGIIIADQVVKVNGTPTILGAAISIGQDPSTSDINGNIDVKFSCQAIAQAVRQGYGTRLTWHRVR